MARLFKVLDIDGACLHGGKGKWSLPSQDNRTWVPGDWRTVEGELIPCKNGLHLCGPEDLLGWMGPAVYEVEYEGEIIVTDNKVVVRKARLLRKLDWDKTKMMLFACDCAERQLPNFEKLYPEDNRPRKAIEAARIWAKDPSDKNATAARSAESAARSAAWSAARSAESAAHHKALMAEKEWQARHLMEMLGKEKGLV
jgi:hypothetical protein